MITLRKQLGQRLQQRLMSKPKYLILTRFLLKILAQE